MTTTQTLMLLIGLIVQSVLLLVAIFYYVRAVWQRHVRYRESLKKQKEKSKIASIYEHTTKWK